jgi:DNA-binding beta-propeller fold protein YncE
VSPDGLLACEQQFASCFLAARQPNVYVSSRAPASLLVGAFTVDNSPLGTNEMPAFTDSIPLTFGPSRIALGRVRVATSLASGPGVVSDPAGNYVLEQRVFVVCFDSRKIYIYDPVRRVIDAIVSTGRGPYALAIDESRGVAYVAHFVDSYLGVISLDQRFSRNYAAIVASVGVPSAPRASK